jgi:pilus assembly protein Flp/PilA
MAARLALSRFLACEKGTTAIEYGLIVTLIFLAIVTAVTQFGHNASNMFNNISSAVTATA